MFNNSTLRKNEAERLFKLKILNAVCDNDGNVLEIEPIMPEWQWRKNGMKVRKGEEPITTIGTWRRIPPKLNSAGRTIRREVVFMAPSRFYSQSQCEPINRRPRQHTVS